MNGARYFVEQNTGYMFGPLFDDLEKASIPIKVCIFLGIVYSISFIFLMDVVGVNTLMTICVVGVHIFLYLFTIFEAFIVYGTI